MTTFRGLGRSLGDDYAPAVPVGAAREQARRPAHSGRLGTGTLACGRCDAPIAAGPKPLAVTDSLSCPFCQHRGPVRDFLSLARPARPARVVIRVGLPLTAG